RGRGHPGILDERADGVSEVGHDPVWTVPGAAQFTRVNRRGAAGVYLPENGGAHRVRQHLPPAPARPGPPRPGALLLRVRGPRPAVRLWLHGRLSAGDP